MQSSLSFFMEFCDYQLTFTNILKLWFSLVYSAFGCHAHARSCGKHQGNSHGCKASKDHTNKKYKKKKRRRRKRRRKNSHEPIVLGDKKESKDCCNGGSERTSMETLVMNAAG